MFHIGKFPAFRAIYNENFILNFAQWTVFRQSSQKKAEVLPAVEPGKAESSELYPDAIDEEEIERKRNKNRLPPRVYKIFMTKETDSPYLKVDFKRSRLRSFYGKYGQGSGLRPGIMWPNKQELSEILEYEKMFNPPLKDTLAKIAAESATLQKERQEYEAQVDSNMSKLDKWVKDHYDKIAKKVSDAEQLKKKRAALIEEISEYLGYDVNPADPKFKEAIEQKEKEKKKKLKEKKQEDNYNKMLQKLSEIAEKTSSGS